VGRAQRTRALAFTLPEVLVVVLIMALLVGLAIPSLAGAADRAAVHSAAAELATTFAAARQLAIQRRASVGVEIDTTRGSVRVRMGEALLVSRNLHRSYAVHLEATRDSMAYDARGLGIGAANLSVVVKRGRRADTLFVSRLGRVRR
jgi:prepilin-type N-terminal cleavage/methylation domain-containing protein